MIVVFWLILLVSLGLFIALQLYILTVCSEIETSNKSPIDVSKTLTKSIKPSFILYGLILGTSLLQFNSIWYIFLIEIGSGVSFYFLMGDSKTLFEPRYLIRDLQKITIRHSVLMFSGALSFVIVMIVFLIKLIK